MTRRRSLAYTWLIAAASLVLSGAARAADQEIREFNVTIDGKQAGDYRMTIQRHDNGSVSMIGQAKIKVSFVVASYRYSYTGSEVWMEGRLFGLQSNTDDDGKKFTVKAVAAGDALKVTANGQERTIRSDVWTTTYWHKPDARFVNKGVPLLDADTGKEMSASLRHVGASEITAAGQRQSCQHYQLRGDVTVDAWYDGRDRLVRQESVEDGHRMVMELKGVR